MTARNRQTGALRSPNYRVVAELIREQALISWVSDDVKPLI